MLKMENYFRIRILLKNSALSAFEKHSAWSSNGSSFCHSITVSLKMIEWFESKLMDLMIHSTLKNCKLLN